LRPRRRPRLRQENRRRRSGGSEGQPGSHRCLPWHQPLRRERQDMGFFLETLLGGLTTGLLYALIGLGFVLIFKASGVFNFAQGAMVLVAALAMARFSGWAHATFGSMFLGNVIAFFMSAILMLGIAIVIERLVLRHLVNQGLTTLLM